MPNLSYVSPFFIVTNLQKSISFYVDKLGFELRYQGPEDDPYFAIVGRDNVSMMIKEIAPGIDPIPNNARHKWARWDAFVSAEDPDRLFEEFKNAGITFRQPLMDNSDNLRGFEVADADGYVLYFGRPAKK